MFGMTLGLMIEKSISPRWAITVDVRERPSADHWSIKGLHGALNSYSSAKSIYIYMCVCVHTFINAIHRLYIICMC